MISIYVATSENGCIGKDNELPWKQRNDLKRLSETTKNHFIIMGRKTHESILKRLNKPLPNRTTIVITRQKNYKTPAGVLVAQNIDQALNLIPKSEKEIFVFGGGEIYNLFLPIADKIYMTKIHKKVEGDTYFPKINDSWTLMSKEIHKKDEHNENDYSFLIYERQK